MSQMNPTKKNLTNLYLNPGQLVRSVPDWVGFLCDVGFTLGVPTYADYLCYCDGGSLAVS